MINLTNNIVCRAEALCHHPPGPCSSTDPITGSIGPIVVETFFGTTKSSSWLSNDQKITTVSMSHPLETRGMFHRWPTLHISCTSVVSSGRVVSLSYNITKRHVT